MWYDLAREALFRLPPETAHDFALKNLSRLQVLGLARFLRHGADSLPVERFGLSFDNPVGLAAGLDKNGDHIDALGALGFGFIEVGTVTPEPQPGNPRPRMFRLPEHKALINRLGFNNRGLSHMIKRLQKRSWRGVLGVNIGRNKTTTNERAVDDYVRCMRGVYTLADYITVNISSPNTEGLRELQSAEALGPLLDVLLDERDALAVRHGVKRPLLVKLAPDLELDQIDASCEIINKKRPDGIIATNTTLAREAVADHPRASEAGGLSGAPLGPRATDVLARFRNGLDREIALIGVGGIVDSNSAHAKVISGADLIQLYTGFIYRGPALIGECVEAFRAHCQ